ncbi:hypothetical protein A3Q56_02026 [Intoshia linei]|uniref:Exocyst complex component Sec8 n=1 Tax=Intoshia linei TaxID=1819745 RepID=A0A177B9K7_9BILA|nr:hypothetical protein A3Q56_02026 [Intoshia linei]
MLNSFNTSMDGQMGTLIPLLATASKKERQKYLDQLDKKFTQSDEKLENLIRQHQKQLNSLSNIFSSVSSNIKESKEKLVLIRNSLNSSKNLLSCKRRQIRDYWTKSVREKYTIEYLKKMESVNETLADFKYLTKNNRIYEAVNRIKLSLSYLENDFADFNALSVVKITIQSTIMDSINEYKKILIDIIYEKNINFSKENVRRSTFVTADLSKIQSKDSVIRNLKDLSNDFLPLLAENPLDFIHLHLYALWTLDGLDHFINVYLLFMNYILK